MRLSVQVKFSGELGRGNQLWQAGSQGWSTESLKHELPKAFGESRESCAAFCFPLSTLQD